MASRYNVSFTGYTHYHRRTQDFTVEEVHVEGGQARGLGTEVPQKLKQNVR